MVIGFYKTFLEGSLELFLPPHFCLLTCLIISHPNLALPIPSVLSKIYTTALSFLYFCLIVFLLKFLFRILLFMVHIYFHD